jgi:transcriptional regulator with XRE-family HTH domain
MGPTHPLKHYRETHRPPLTQDQLADQLGVARTTVARWETGTRKVELDQIPRITKKTGIPASVLRPDLAAIFDRVAPV